MLIKKPVDIRYSEITPKHIYMNRRNFLAGAPAAFLGARELLSPPARALAGMKLPNVQKSKYTVDEKQNSYQEVSTYNNYYEFGTSARSKHIFRFSMVWNFSNAAAIFFPTNSR